jgi:hypothetical protein
VIHHICANAKGKGCVDLPKFLDVEIARAAACWWGFSLAVFDLIPLAFAKMLGITSESASESSRLILDIKQHLHHKQHDIGIGYRMRYIHYIYIYPLVN